MDGEAAGEERVQRQRQAEAEEKMRPVATSLSEVETAVWLQHRICRRRGRR